MPLLDQIDRNTLVRMLSVGGESDCWDFKRDFDLQTARGRIELAKDILAFANTEGGGHIIFGVDDKTREPIGIASDKSIDTTIIFNAISRYTTSAIRLAAASYDIDTDPRWSGARRFGIIFVERYDGVAAVPSAAGNYSIDDKKQHVAFRPGEIYTRRGAQSVIADGSALDMIVERMRFSKASEAKTTRAPILDNLPPREQMAVDFVGRARELINLWEWFRDPHRKRWLLAGDGGKGKSAIAYEFATQVKDAPPDWLASILWLSAKRRQYEDGTVESIDSPDFWDLTSLIERIAQLYGFDELGDLGASEKRGRVIELLREFPGLLVIDDVDSLPPDDEDAIEFLLELNAGGSKTKVILTSRRVPYGLHSSTSQISGLSEQEGRLFIASRVQLFGFDSNIFSSSVTRDIVKVTEGSPLFIEDLLRLCRSLPVGRAIKEWRERGGEGARAYALERELELLSPHAKDIVLACCLNPGPVAFSEVQAVTGLNDQQLSQELRASQNLFLLSKPRLIDGVERFDVNANTRLLVLSVFDRTEQMRRLRNAWKALTDPGDKDERVRSRTAGYIRQAISLERLNRLDDAEQTILTALDRYPSEPDLIAQLGQLYARWRPNRRSTDARANFRRAAQLKCQRESIYEQWADLELQDEEWTAAASAAETGNSVLGMTVSLLYLAGYARSRLGQELKRGRHMSRASEELIRADTHLRRALSQGADRLVRDYRGRIYRALVINAEALGDYRDVQHWLAEWALSLPNDPNLLTETERLRPRLRRT